MSARELIETLGLGPHFEGGWFRELYRSGIEVGAPQGRRTALTSIYYLLEQGQRSRWHVVSSDEVWHFYAGAGLELLAYDPGSRTLTRHVLASPAAGGARAGSGSSGDPGAASGDGRGRAQGSVTVAVIPPGAWQAARPLGDYALVGCTVAPGFELMDFKFVADLPGHRAHFAGALAGYTGLL